MVPLVEVVGGRKDLARGSPPRDRVLRVHRKEADPPSQRSRRARCQSASAAVSRRCHYPPRAMSRRDKIDRRQPEADWQRARDFFAKVDRLLSMDA